MVSFKTPIVRILVLWALLSSACGSDLGPDSNIAADSDIDEKLGFGWDFKKKASPSSTTDSAGASPTRFRPVNSASSYANGSSSAVNTASAISVESDSSSIKSVAHGYVPYATTCPDTPLTREANGLNSYEEEYVRNRQEKTNDNLVDFLRNKAQLQDFDADSFIANVSEIHNITISLAFSGGGYRAMLNGAGQILALDNRFENSTQLGGLLQSSTYLAGLSGGSFLVGTLVLNDWISVADILEDKIDIWNLENNLLDPYGWNLIKEIAYLQSTSEAIEEKEDAGFDVTYTDFFGRALSYQFFPDETGGINLTWSGIRDLESFKSHDMPFPIILSMGKPPNSNVFNLNSTVFEITPYEIGSWDASLNYFTDVKYTATDVNNGDPETDECIVNFDNAGFIIATTATIFNQVANYVGESTDNKIVNYIVQLINSSSEFQENDISIFDPNPFYNLTDTDDSFITESESLYLVDGGEGTNIPISPLIQQDRGSDIVIAFDSSADTAETWPNGTALVSNYERQFSPQGKGKPFPYVPSVDSIVSDGLNKRPVFFGCDASNLTDLVQNQDPLKITETDIPLVVYIPNHYQSYNSNFSTVKLAYDNEEVQGMIRNGFEVSTRGNLTDDGAWATCVGCAIIRRSQERLSIEQTDECKQCFQDYCWTGTPVDQ